MTDYVTHLAPQVYDEIWTSPEWERASVHMTVASPIDYRSLSIEGDREVILKRALGCLMILRMPDLGLNEALGSLTDMLDFYIDAPQLNPPARCPDQLLTGKAGPSSKRPDLVLES